MLLRSSKIVLNVEQHTESDESEHLTIIVQADVNEDATMTDLQSAAEYLTFVVAKNSPEGFERALENIAHGAMAYHIQKRSGL